MDAGRELDEFVGERVFKLKVERAERWWIEGERDWTDDGELVYLEGVNVRRLPAYSTDNACIIPVIDEVYERFGAAIIVGLLPSWERENGDGPYFVRMSGGRVKYDRFGKKTFDGDNPAELVCQAAIYAAIHELPVLNATGA